MNRQDKRRVERAADAETEPMIDRLASELKTEAELSHALNRIRMDLLDKVNELRAVKTEPKQAEAFSS